MKIIVVGCGKVGSALTRQLSEEGHDVSVIDVNQQVVNEVSSSCDVIGVVGNGGSHAVQKEVGVEDADLIERADPHGRRDAVADLRRGDDPGHFEAAQRFQVHATVLADVLHPVAAYEINLGAAAREKGKAVAVKVLCRTAPAAAAG